MLGMVAALAVGWATFAFRFQAPTFQNDHFEHLSMARQMLAGELPGRDFFEPGRPLTVALSALAQQLLGQTLLSEALLTIGAMAIGTAITFRLAREASGSFVIALLAAILTAAISPRLYAYPKIIVFAVVAWCAWRYFERPARRQLVILSAATVAAFLMRHDFGIYSGLAVVAGLVAFDRTAAWRSIGAYAVIGLLLVSPYLVWLQLNGRLLGQGVSGASTMIGETEVVTPGLRLNLSEGIARLDPVRAHVAIRWSATVDPATRARLESAHGLVDGRSQGGSTYEYGLVDDSTENLRQLVSDPRVEDTNGIDRGAAAIARPWWEDVAQATGLARFEWAPIFSRAAAEAWLYYLFLLIPIAAMVRLYFKGSARLEFGAEGAKIVCVAVLGVLVNVYLVRGSLDSRLPDVVVPAAIVGAWLLGEHVRWVRGIRSAGLRSIQGAIAAVLILLTWVSLTTYSGVSAATLATAPFQVSRLRATVADLGRRPIDVGAPAGSTGVAGLTRFVHECTMPQDRLLLVTYEPQVFYYSERLFAGGMAFFHQRSHSSDADQILIVRTLESEQVPFVIVDERSQRTLEEDYPRLSAYLQQRFVPAGVSTFGGDGTRRFRILADPSRHATTTRHGLPCFSGGPEGPSPPS